MSKKLFAIFVLSALISLNSHSVELIIGEENVEPGITYIFEGAVKDNIFPKNLHLEEKNTHVHIEARVNWADSEESTPEGTPSGGFVPYLKITAEVTNEDTKLSTFIDLLPHINLIDNFHYARNISLPGDVADNYTVEFNILPPSAYDLALHKDWTEKYGDSLTKSKTFKYKNVNFEEIAKASRD